MHCGESSRPHTVSAHTRIDLLQLGRNGVKPVARRDADRTASSNITRLPSVKTNGGICQRFMSSRRMAPIGRTRNPWADDEQPARIDRRTSLVDPLPSFNSPQRQRPFSKSHRHSFTPGRVSLVGLGSQPATDAQTATNPRVREHKCPAYTSGQITNR